MMGSAPRGCVRSMGNVATDVVSITGTSGTWTNVTPAGLDLNSSSNGADNFGVQGVWRDPSRRGAFVAFTCYNGVWRSIDFGATWVKVSVPGAVMDGGKAWAAAVAPDGSYLLGASGANFTQFGGVDGRRQVFKSTDNGATWTPKGDMGGDPYSFDILSTDKTKAIVTFHDTNHLSLSTDSGETWVDKGAVTAGGTDATASLYAHWIDATHVLALSQVGGTSNGEYLGTLSAGAFTWSIVSAAQFHAHGSHQIDIDPSTGVILSPGDAGVERSASGGATWTGVTMATGPTNNLIRTLSTIYACYSFPSGGSTTDPKLQHAAVPGTTGTWTADSTPTGMTNGWMHADSATDGSRWVVVAGCWNAGIWRYIE